MKSSFFWEVTGRRLTFIYRHFGTNSLKIQAVREEITKRITELLTFIYHGATGPPPRGPGPPHYRGFKITLRHTTLGITPLE